MSDSKVGHSYQARTPQEQQAAYDDWAESYERDLCSMGYRIPAMAAAVFTRHVAADAAPILDAGCGGGIQAEPLVAIGYGPFTGIDLSEGMLSIARSKGIYAELRQMALGGRLDFPDGAFAAILSCGTITPGHAPPESFDDLIRVTRPGGRLVFSLRDDATQDPAYPAALERLTQADAWHPVFATEPFHSMPYGEPEVRHRVHVYERGR